MIRSLVLSIALATAAAVAAVALVPATAHAEGEKVSSKVGKPLKAAQEAMKKEDWDTALAKTMEADAVADKTPFDDYQIAEFLGFLYLKKQDYANAAKAYDRQLASQYLPEDQRTERLKAGTQLHFQLQEYPKAIEYGTKWIEAAGSSDVNAYLLTGQAYYLVQDYANSAKTLKASYPAFQAANKPVPENVMQIVLSSYNQLDDNANVIASLEDLVQHYPNPKYWDQLLSYGLRTVEVDERTTLQTYRLMHEVGVLSRPEDLVDMAQLAFEAGLPGEAVTVMEEGYSKKLLDDKDQERRKRLLSDARTQAANDQKQLPSLDKEARAATTGTADVGLGAAYLSYGQVDKAIEALERGIKKGGVKRMDDAQMALGRAYLKANRREDAAKAFDAVPDDSKLARVADLWAIYARQAQPAAPAG